nr:3'(2'),5'-bisphosphate nucleotidase CysQ [Oceanospirillaceae bacterium]
MLQAQKIVTNSTLLAELVQLTNDAGDAILEIYHSDDFGIGSKADASPVTAADLAAHHFLMAGLKRLTPHIPVVSEEDADSLKIPHYNACYWLIDPLDGTKEFISKNGEFTVNLALIE